MNTLRRFTLAIGLTIVLVSSLAHATSFIIELTNGREVSTSRLWEDGDEIKFSTVHGTAGISKHQVKRITTATLGTNDQVSRRSVPASATDPTVATTGRPPERTSPRDAEGRHEQGNSHAHQAQRQNGEVKLKDGNARSYHEKKVMLTSQLDDATKTYLDASAARNPDAKKAALDRMRDYSKQIIELGDEVKHKNGGVLPPWWNE